MDQHNRPLFRRCVWVQRSHRQLRGSRAQQVSDAFGALSCEHTLKQFSAQSKKSQPYEKRLGGKGEIFEVDKVEVSNQHHNSPPPGRDETSPSESNERVVLSVAQPSSLREVREIEVPSAIEYDLYSQELPVTRPNLCAVPSQ
ncbi:hypothetical protein ZHAS_00008539 [Anopheles sinensis]|uniref:Uncharacterized protein n=1 Tax=Anopheles sinensis TaxID=74873 RepID=A0A084VSY9_ANOSI|nr:hypothetical protein ZHAS_00008539 [Anopheles sinensis]